VAEGHGDVAGTYNDTVLAMDSATLAVKDYFTPLDALPALKPGVEAPGVTPAVFSWNGKDVIVAGSRNGRLYLLDSGSLGGADHHTPLAVSDPIVAPDTDFGGNGIWGTFATFTDTANQNARWIYAAVRGPVVLKGVTVNGAAPSGSIVAFKVEDAGGKPTLTPQWVSGDLLSPEGPVTAAGLVYALSSGLSPRVAKKDGTPYTVGEVEKMAKPAILHVLDGETGKEVFSSGTAATTFAHSGIAVANGRVFFTTHDNTLFVYGVPFER
jgi:outer membrane protein assembly factor BamB